MIFTLFIAKIKVLYKNVSSTKRSVLVLISNTNKTTKLSHFQACDKNFRKLKCLVLVNNHSYLLKNFDSKVVFGSLLCTFMAIIALFEPIDGS